MMRRIQQLPLEVSSQIAAGEVVVGPASVVKELLENARDAQADVIHIELEYGGLNRIQVSDNGTGIAADDLLLAVAPHATSKITQLTDLYVLQSMGFRGEALASIAAVSRFALISRPLNQEHAMMLRMDGIEVSQSPTARNYGTTVTVQDLFFNIPVRKKFLKSIHSEFLAVEQVIKRFALSAPQTTLRFKHDGKDIFSLSPAQCPKTRKARLAKLLGKSFVEDAVQIDVESGSLRLQGWISGRNYQRSQNDKLWVYINQRMVKDKLMLHALMQAYEPILHPGRYPACVLYLSIPTPDVDVNVHPTKHEVRFQQPRLVHDFIVSQVSAVLTQLSSQMPLEYQVSSPLPVVAVQEKAPVLPYVSGASRNLSSSPSWYILNAQFAMVQAEQPFLVDVRQLHRYALMEHFKTEHPPFSSRPLLVPLTYDVACDAAVFSEPLLNQLETMGMDVAWVSETRLMVRTIPKALPRLDVQCVLEKLRQRKAKLDDQQLLHIFLDSQSFNAQQLSAEEQESLHHHFMQCVVLGKPMTWCLKLDTHRCRELLYA